MHHPHTMSVINEVKKPRKDIVALGNVNTRRSQNKRTQIKALETNKSPVNLMPYQQPIAMILNLSSQEHIYPKLEHHHDTSRVRSLHS